MKDWARIAEGLGLRIPPADLERAARSLERVEERFRPLVEKIPFETEPAYLMILEPEKSE